jgi:drug/metabolite transporter (DMT)-like permease
LIVKIICLNCVFQIKDISIMKPLESERSVSGLVLAIIGAIAFSGKAIIVKLSYRFGVDAVTVLMLRMLLSFPFFLLLGWWSERRAHARANPLTALDWWRIVALGVLGYYLSSFLDFLGLQYTTASLERLILYLNPTLVLLLSRVFYKKPIHPVRLLAMGVSYLGVLVVFGHELNLAGDHVALGAALVFASAVSYAFYLMLSGQWVQRIGSLRLVGWATSVACVCCIAQFFLLRSPSALNVPTEVWQLSILNAIACTVAPVLMVMMAIERIGAGLTSQTGMIGPMSTIMMGVLILDEPLNVWIGLGTMLVLTGVFIVSKYGAK